jgi:hypothetical protein
MKAEEMSELASEIVGSAFNLIASLKRKEACYIELLEFQQEIRAKLKYDAKPPSFCNETFEEYVYRRINECTGLVDDEY